MATSGKKNARMHWKIGMVSVNIVENRPNHRMCTINMEPVSAFMKFFVRIVTHAIMANRN